MVNNTEIFFFFVLEEGFYRSSEAGAALEMITNFRGADTLHCKRIRRQQFVAEKTKIIETDDCKYDVSKDRKG